MQSWILLADDDPEDREIISEALQQVDDKAVLNLVENGEQVLLSLDKNGTSPTLPCLIILDLNMPKLNGTETLRILKTEDRFKNIPVIIYSTSINPLEKEKCMKLGAHSYLTKPVSIKESLDRAKFFLEFCEQHANPLPLDQSF